MYLSIIIPAYNEEKRIEKTLREINNYLKKQSYDSEILVVSDGSRDRTNEIVKNLRETEIKNLNLIEEKENYGKGYAVRIGMLKANGKYRLFSDSDNSTPIEQIEKIWPEFEKGFDIVIGSRDIKGAILDPPQKFLRRVLGKIFILVRKIIIGLWELQDTQCGFKAFTEQSALEIFPKCKINRFAFDPEVLLIAKKFGFKIKEIPIYWKNDPLSKVKFKSMVKMFIDLLKIRLNNILKVYDKKNQ